MHTRTPVLLPTPQVAWTRLVSFLEAQGLSAPLVKPRLNTDGTPAGGLVVTQDVKQGDKLASIPKKVKLNLDAATASPLGRVMQAVLEQGMPVKEALALFMFYELHRTDTPSSFAPLFDLLPAKMDVPLFFSAEDAAYMQGSVASLVGLQKAAAARVHNLLTQLCAQPMNAAFFDCDALTSDEISWIMFVVHARGQTDDNGEFALMPLVDQLRTSFTLDANAGLVTSKSGRSVLTALRDIKAGEEVLLAVQESTVGTSYATTGVYDGRKSFLSLEYNVPSYDDTGDVFTATTNEMLKLSMCFVSGAPAYKLRLGGTLPESFMDCLRIAHMTPSDLNTVIQYETLTKERWPPGKRFSLDGDLAALAMLHRSFSAGLQAYATTVEEDAAILANSSLSPRARELVAIRQAEKELLQHAVRTVEQRWLDALLEATQ